MNGSTVSTEDLPPGILLSSRYRVGMLIGRGAMGAVYEATRVLDGVRVALKVLSEETRQDPSAMQRFEREAQAASRLGHPGIVKVFDFQKDPHEPAYLVMELLEGHSLGKEIEAVGALPFGRVVQIASDVLAALSAAHGRGLVHRDIKPDNIVLLTGEHVSATCKLVDFGVVKIQGQALTQAGQVIGTPAYMSPEQWQGQPVDGRSDLYALGGSLYHALMGRPAVTSVTQAVEAGFSAGRARALLTEKPEIPPGFVQIVARALESNPAARYANADDMIHALRSAQMSPSHPRPLYTPAPPAPPTLASNVAPSGHGTNPPLPATMPPPTLLSAQARPSYASQPSMLLPMPGQALPLQPAPMQMHMPMHTPMPGYGPQPFQGHSPGMVPQQASPPWWKTDLARNLFIALAIMAALSWILPNCLLFGND
jgi:serine/threonine-protein kinase